MTRLFTLLLCAISFLSFSPETQKYIALFENDADELGSSEKLKLKSWFDFKPVTLMELKQEIAKLNRI